MPTGMRLIVCEGRGVVSGWGMITEWRWGLGYVEDVVE
jgi:hypothetical protein